ncbi:MAG: metallophosphoesterase [Phycisphaerae bacterium]|nr:metallophosphoesterase [Phycisphaerae bacterium]MDW8262247.1 metallophosphoesterase [Phycisphaerales bacterium]
MSGRRPGRIQPGAVAACIHRPAGWNCAGLVIGPTPSTMRWIIGDIHGYAKPLDRLLEAVREADRDAVVLFVGDYVNRGPDSRAVIERLLRMNNARFCRGNHDNVFDLLLNGSCYDVRQDMMHPHHLFSSFLDAGLDRTLLSYEIDLAMVYSLAVDFSIPRLRELLSPVPAEHRQFFRRLEPVIEHDDLFVVHARWPADQADGPELLIDLLAGSRRLRHEALWGRYNRLEIAAPKSWRRRGFFGHTPVSFYRLASRSVALPILGERMVLLDTAIALGLDGRLTAYCADTDRFLQVDRQLDVVELAARETLFG